MTLLVDDPPANSALSPAQRLRGTMAAVALHFTWFGVRKSLNTEQKAQAADAFGAEGAYLSAGKKLIDTSHPARWQSTQAPHCQALMSSPDNVHWYDRFQPADRDPVEQLVPRFDAETERIYQSFARYMRGSPTDLKLTARAKN